MTIINLTSEQEKIINENDCCVVIAKPGSGKTYVLSQKITKILPNLPEYQGIIAISFTNKASNQLRKYLNSSLNKKRSFFGTIDKFYISEIIIPFGKQIFGRPKIDFSIIELNDIHSQKNKFDWLNSNFNYNDLTQEQIDSLKTLFLHGKIIIESIGILANYIFDTSLSCRKYLCARYTHIFIDEYQDSGYEQHEIFLKIKNLGIYAFAVGDIDQSIFGFAGKSSEYLISLSKNPDFVVHTLTYNHRSHPSIVDYSMELLGIPYPNGVRNEIRIYEKLVEGSEYEIASWLNNAINKFCELFAIEKMNEVAILVKNNRTGRIIDENLQLNHKYSISSELDINMSYWSVVFRRILYLLFDKNDNKIEAIEDFLDIADDDHKVKIILKLIDILYEEIQYPLENFQEIIDLFINIAEVIYPKNRNERSITLLRSVIRSESLMNSFKPAEENEIQLMTLHKSKGMEFDLVFHLDLYEWILPRKRIIYSQKPIFTEYQQDINLHYVGITRARMCCVLCTSSQRHKSDMKITSATPSEFFFLNNLQNLRIISKF